MRTRRRTPEPLPVTVYLDGAETEARTGDTVAAVLIRHNRPVTLFCGMGACHACAVTIEGIPGRRACIEEVRDGLHVELPGQRS